MSRPILTKAATPQENAKEFIKIFVENEAFNGRNIT